MSGFLGLLAAALYLSAAFNLRRSLAGQGVTRRPLQHALPAVFALAAHAGSVALTGTFNLAITNALSLAAWAMVAILLCLAARNPVQSLGVLVLPPAALIVAVVPFVSVGTSTHIDAGVWLHALLSLSAYGVLCLAAAQACLVAWHTAQLRQAPGAGPSRLPPLAAMERLMFRLLAIGLAILTLAIVTGFAFLDDMFAQRVAHKTVFSLLAWAAFAALLAGHHLAGWRGKTALRWTLTGMVLLIVGFFGSKLVLEVFLANGT